MYISIGFRIGEYDFKLHNDICKTNLFYLRCTAMMEGNIDTYLHDRQILLGLLDSL